MVSHQDQILEKMKGVSYIELNFDFAFSLTNESERGAVLVGTSKIEIYLEKLLLTIIPESTKAYISRLFGYPGPLSSLSGKIELLYAFRIIDIALYNSLSALRKIRNQAAHTSETFDLQSAKQQLNIMFAFEENFPQVIEQVAYDNLIKFKLMQIKRAFDESNMKGYDYQKIWEERYPDPKQNEAILKQLIIWELSYAMTFLCLKIEAITDEYNLLYKNLA